MSEIQDNPVASKFRLFWAFYIDFCLFSVVLSFVHFLSPKKIVFLTHQVEFLILFVLIIFLQIILMKVFKVQSVGYMALGITLNPSKEISLFDPQKFLVDRQIKENENWMTMLIALILINDGCKQMIQWMLNQKSPPLYGVTLTGAWEIFFSILIGVFLILVGIDLLRLKVWSAYATIGYFLILVGGILISYPQAADWALQQMTLMAQDRGKELTQANLRSTASMMINILVVIGILGAGTVYKNLFRFRK